MIRRRKPTKQPWFPCNCGNDNSNNKNKRRVMMGLLRLLLCILALVLVGLRTFHPGIFAMPLLVGQQQRSEKHADATTRKMVQALQKELNAAHAKIKELETEQGTLRNGCNDPPKVGLREPTPTNLQRMEKKTKPTAKLEVDFGYEFPPPRTELGMPANSPKLEGQPFLATPLDSQSLHASFGRGGKQSYRFYKGSWDQWLSLPNDDQPNNSAPRTHWRSTDSTVLKLIMMTKDEWPLIQKWIVYHGKLVGFENLYVLDGSTDEQQITYLRDVARGQLGVNVLFSKANLNELERQIRLVAQELGGSTHAIIKMDSDEFLAVDTGNSGCVSLASATSNGDHSENNSTDCSISPYGISEYLNSQQFRSLLTGNLLRIGYISASRVSGEYCTSGKGAMYHLGSAHEDDNNLVTFFSVRDTNYLEGFKAVYDARTISTINLGGHVRQKDLCPPFRRGGVAKTNLAILHFHDRCPEDLFRINAKIVRGHGFVKETETDQQALQRFKTKLRLESLCDLTVQQITRVTKSNLSMHKVIGYLGYLDGCPAQTAMVSLGSGTKRNPDFYHFLRGSMSAAGL